ncbi:MAG: response regulator [Thermacetogeniaceae bacterium]
MSKIILLVEDNADDSIITLRALRKARVADEIIVARNGAEALDYLFGTGLYEGRDTSIMPAVVLLDLKMPKIDGFEVLQRIRSSAATKTLPVVIITTSNEEKDIKRSFDLGANGYLPKPVDYIRFAEDVKQLAIYTGS